MKIWKQGQINSDTSTLIIACLLFTDIEKKNYHSWHAYAKCTYT